jgi:transglutaminase-like putative cysteine protease
VRYWIRHTTRYRYTEPVSQCHSLTHLLPRDTARQRCVESRIEVQPIPALGNTRIDYFGNHSYHFTVQWPHTMLEVTAFSTVDVEDFQPSLGLDFGISCLQARNALQHSTEPAALEAREFLLESPLVHLSAELAEYARPSFSDDRPLLSAVRDLVERIYREFTYDPVSTTVSTPVADVLAHRRGVCQDFAHLAIGCLRSLGYPARYVSGYLETLPAPGTQKLIGADASHAWFAVYSPVEGWQDFDPTNNTVAAQQHITTAWGRDFADVTPLKGTVFGGGRGHTVEVEVDVARG